MCDHLDIDMPQFEDESTIRFEGDNKDKKSAKDEEETKDESQYENEEEEYLYSNLIDLKEYVPEALLMKKGQAQQEKEKPQESPLKKAEEEKTEKQEESTEPEKSESIPQVDNGNFWLNYALSNSHCS